MADNNADPNAQAKALNRAIAERRAAPARTPHVAPLEDARASVEQAQQSVAQRSDKLLIERVMDSRGIPGQHAGLTRSLLLDYAYTNGLQTAEQWQQHEQAAAEYVDQGLRRSGIVTRAPTAEQRAENLKKANMSDRAWLDYQHAQARRGR